MPSSQSSTSRVKWTLSLLAIAATAVALGFVFYWPFQRDKTLRLSGVVEIQEIRLGSKIGGRISEVRVEEGQTVEGGQPLVIFETPELEASRQQLMAKVQYAQAEYQRVVNGARPEERDAAHAAAAAARARYEKWKFGFREEEKRQLAADLSAAQAEFIRAEEEIDRVMQLYRIKSASKSELDAAVSQRDRARSNVGSLKAKVDMVQSGSRPEEIAEAKAEWQKAQAKAEELDAGSRFEDILLAQAGLQEALGKLREVEVNLAEGIVRAPEKVEIEVVAVRKGDIVAPNQPILRVQRDVDRWVKVFIPEPDMGKVQTNDAVEIVTDAYPNLKLKGRITFIAPISEFTPRNIQSSDERRHQVFAAKVMVDDPGKTLRSGMAAEVLLPLRDAPK